MSEPINFYQLNDALLNDGIVISASEVHGFMCGLLCQGRLSQDSQPKEGDAHATSESTWMAEFKSFAGIDEYHAELSDDTLKLIHELKLACGKSLKDEALGFRLMLPEDSDGLNRRTIELGQWCQGFLNGVVRAGLDAKSMISPQAAEGMRDLAQIAQIDSAEDDSEENEKYWNETVEYVKIIVLTVYQEMASAAECASGGSSDDRNQNKRQLH